MKALSILVLAFSCFLLVPLNIWWIELFQHFIFPLTLSCLLLCLWFIFKRQKLMLVISIFALSVNFYQIFEHLPISKNQLQTQPNFKVYSANALSSNLAHNLIIEQIHEYQPDVITIQEFSFELLESLKILDAIYPNQILIPRTDNFGIALYSKLPIPQKHTHYFGSLGLPTIEATITATIDIKIFTTHPTPPINADLFNARNAHLNELAFYVKYIKTPLIVTGDFNNTPYTHTFKDFLNQAGLIQTRKFNGLNPTWPSKIINTPLSLPIDHILVSTQLNQFELDVLDDIGSDHRPMTLSLYLQ